MRARLYQRELRLEWAEKSHKVLRETMWRGPQYVNIVEFS